MAAVLEYLTAEILDTTISNMSSNKESTIKPFNLLNGLNSDHETSKIFKDVEVRVYDPNLRVQRIDVIGRAPEKYYDSKAVKNI